jgi:hypothetical protein
MKKVLALVVVGLLSLSLAAFAADAPKAQIVKGFLSDVLDGKAGKDAAGVELTKTPEKLAVKSLVTEEAAKSGYGIFVLDEKTKAYVFHAFDAKGNELAVKNVLTTVKDANAAGLQVEVQGALDPATGAIAVENIKPVVAEKAADAKAEVKEPAKEEKKQEPPAKEETKKE